MSQAPTMGALHALGSVTVPRLSYAGIPRDTLSLDLTESELSGVRVTWVAVNTELTVTAKSRLLL